jgi:citronellyl-CoA synthetase
MAAFVLAEGVKELDVTSFSAYINEHLPSYAQPVFLRIQPQMDTTGTFKMVKGDLRKENYDLKQINEPVYVLKPRSKTYERLDTEFAAILRAGDGGY